MQLPLFPVPIYLLPKGISKLKVFEPRYLRLVKLATESGDGFGLCMQDDHTLCHFGTRVIITDFEPLPDGLLGITIEGVEKFIIEEDWHEKDGLRFGNVSPIDNWRKATVGGDDQAVSNSLRTLFEKHPELAAHYPSPEFNDLAWVCQRWLEVLPLATSQKQWFMSRKDHLAALSFLHTLIEDEHASG